MGDTAAVAMDGAAAATDAKRRGRALIDEFVDSVFRAEKPRRELVHRWLSRLHDDNVEDVIALLVGSTELRVFVATGGAGGGGGAIPSRSHVFLFGRAACSGAGSSTTTSAASKLLELPLGAVPFNTADSIDALAALMLPELGMFEVHKNADTGNTLYHSFTEDEYLYDRLLTCGTLYDIALQLLANAHEHGGPVLSAETVHRFSKALTNIDPLQHSARHDACQRARTAVARAISITQEHYPEPTQVAPRATDLRYRTAATAAAEAPSSPI